MISVLYMDTNLKRFSPKEIHEKQIFLVHDVRKISISIFPRDYSQAQLKFYLRSVCIPLIYTKTG
jgi:hypothetical protein